MGDKTGIEWAEATWNPTTGCDRVSPGCDHCYALTLAARLKAMGSKGYQADGDPRTSGPGFKLTLQPDRLDQPLRWTRARRIFVNSMSDLFHKDVPDEYLARVFAVMALAQQHTFQVLTKRHGRMRSLLNSPAFYRMVRESLFNDHRLSEVDAFGTERFPLPNVWLGVSVEDQQRADLRIPALLETPAAVRFLSCEPLLGGVDLPSLSGLCQVCGGTGVSAIRADVGGIKSGPVDCYHCRRTGEAPARLDWVIVGGESGPGHRPIDPEWVRWLRDQCSATGVSFLFKQWGGATPKAGGRELDGVTHDGYPSEVA